MGNEGAKATIYFAGDDLFVGVSPSGHAQALDTNHERASAASPIELLLIALGSCTAVDVISILRKKREQVTDYRVEVRGERRTEHPRSFTRMEVCHIVQGRNISEKALAQAIDNSGSTNAVAVAHALERAAVNLQGQGAAMRSADHQLQQQLVVGVMDRQGTAGVKFDVEGSGYGFRVVKTIEAARAELPTTCVMARPA